MRRLQRHHVEAPRLRCRPKHSPCRVHHTMLGAIDGPPPLPPPPPPSSSEEEAAAAAAVKVAPASEDAFMEERDRRRHGRVARGRGATDVVSVDVDDATWHRRQEPLLCLSIEDEAEVLQGGLH